MTTGKRLAVGTLVGGLALLATLPWSATAAAGPRATSASTTAGVTLTGSGGCQGSGTSFNGSGGLLAVVSAPGGGGASSSRALQVDRNGTVRWHGSTSSVITHHSWWVHVDGFPAKSGGSANNSHSTHASGEEHVSNYLPSWLGLTGTFYVNGKISGTGGQCTGAMYVKINGDPATGALLWIGIALVLLGGFLTFLALPTANRHPVTGLFGGVLLGLGVIILIVLFGLAAFTSWWPFAVILGGIIVLGALLGSFGPSVRQG